MSGGGASALRPRPGRVFGWRMCAATMNAGPAGCGTKIEGAVECYRPLAADREASGPDRRTVADVRRVVLHASLRANLERRSRRTRGDEQRLQARRVREAVRDSRSKGVFTEPLGKIPSLSAELFSV